MSTPTSANHNNAIDVTTLRTPKQSSSAGYFTVLAQITRQQQQNLNSQRARLSA